MNKPMTKYKYKCTQKNEPCEKCMGAHFGTPSNHHQKTESIINDLLQIKRSIILGGHGGVTDTVWMMDGAMETVCDRIDGVLIELGMGIDEIDDFTGAWDAGIE